MPQPVTTSRNFFKRTNSVIIAQFRNKVARKYKVLGIDGVTACGHASECCVTFGRGENSYCLQRSSHRPKNLNNSLLLSVPSPNRQKLVLYLLENRRYSFVNHKATLCHCSCSVLYMNETHHSAHYM